MKSHPRHDLRSLLERFKVRGASNVDFLESSASVIELIGEAWVIVLCNHYGSVVVQAVMSGKPIIFLDSARFFLPYTDKLAFAAGELVRDLASFWNLIRSLRDSPALYQELSARCQRFGAEYLRPFEETLAQRIRSLEAKPVPDLSCATL